MLWLQKKKKKEEKKNPQKSTPRFIWNQHQAIEGKTLTINLIAKANSIQYWTLGSLNRVPNLLF